MDEFREKIRKEILKPHVERADLFLEELFSRESAVEGKIKQPCFECHRETDHWHHVVPRSKGGTNMVPLCVKCHGMVHGIQMSTSHLIKVGMVKAKENGQRWGRKKTRNDSEILALRARGKSLREIAKQLNISKGSVQAAINNFNKEPDRYPSGQRGCAVNALASAFVGSTPTLSTIVGE